MRSFLTNSSTQDGDCGIPASPFFFLLGCGDFLGRERLRGEISNYFWLSTCGYVLMRMLLSCLCCI